MFRNAIGLTKVIGIVLMANVEFVANSYAAGQTIIPIETQKTTAVAAENFTGRAWFDGAFSQTAPARLYGGYVTFEPGARTNWHTHPLGQTLIVTHGVGLSQELGGPVREIRAGDIVVCPPGVRHWHGARPDTAMQHLAIGERAENARVEWFEKIDDAVYLTTPTN